MANFLTSAATAGASSEFTVVAGTPQTVFLTKADTTTAFPDGARIDVQIKSSDGQFTTLASLTPDNKPATSVSSPGTYRLYRQAAAAAYGADKA